jgi:aryl-alcohol dehydrogenase-like predicted oxidoreductase
VQYRKYGKSGQLVSEVGIGGHREGVEAGENLERNARFFLPVQERARVIGYAIDQGITYFDTTFGCEIQSLGESLRLLKRRDGLFISGMRVDFFTNLLKVSQDVRTYTRREVEARLQESGLDYLDQFLLGALEFGDPLHHPRGCELQDALDELVKLRDEGKCRFIGFSTHTPDYAAQLLEKYPVFDAVMVPYNFANREAEGTLTDVIERQETAWIAMKTHIWHIYGIPVTVLRHLKPISGRISLDTSAAIGQYALQFVLQNPKLTTCVPAMNTVAAVRENVKASLPAQLDNKAQQQLQDYASAMQSENFMPLAIGGLLEENMRVQFYAINLLNRQLGTPAPAFNLTASDAEKQIKLQAEAHIIKLKAMPEWAPLIPKVTTSG